MVNVTNHDSSTSAEYLSCYWTLQVQDFDWKDGSDIEVTISSQTNVQTYLYGGTSRDNASYAIISNNQSANSSATYSVDVSYGMLLMMVPDESDTNTSLTFSYRATGEQYSFM